MSRLVEIARLRVPTHAAAAAIRTTAHALGCDVEVRPAGAGWLVVVEALHEAPAIGERLVLLARVRAA